MLKTGIFSLSLLASLSLFFLSSKSALAICARNIGYSDQADVIVIGTVTSLEDANNASASIAAAEYFKGRGSNEIKVKGYGSIPTSDSFSFQINKKYLLFLKKLPDGSLITDLCQGSRMLNGDITAGERLLIKATPSFSLLTNKYLYISIPALLIGFIFIKLIRK